MVSAGCRPPLFGDLLASGGIRWSDGAYAPSRAESAIPMHLGVAPHLGSEESEEESDSEEQFACVLQARRSLGGVRLAFIGRRELIKVAAQRCIVQIGSQSPILTAFYEHFWISLMP